MPKDPLQYNPFGDWIPEMLETVDKQQEKLDPAEDVTPVESHPALDETQKTNATSEPVATDAVVTEIVVETPVADSVPPVAVVAPVVPVAPPVAVVAPVVPVVPPVV